MADFISAKFETGDLLAGLLRFENQVVEKVLFTGAATMARVIYDEVKINTSPPKMGRKTGNLHNSIYWVHSPEESTPTRKVYKVSFRKGKGQGKHGYLVEFGHWQPYKVVKLKNGDWFTTKHLLPTPKWIPPKPFLRPAFSHMPRAINAGLANMTVRFNREIFA